MCYGGRVENDVQSTPPSVYFSTCIHSVKYARFVEAIFGDVT